MNEKSDKIGILLSKEGYNLLTALLRKEYQENRRNGEWYYESEVIEVAKELNIIL